MYKKIFVGLVLLGILTTAIAACGIYDEANVPTGPTVHMGGANFLQSSIKISKGQSINLIDDVAVEHIIRNGTWNGNNTVLKAEAGAPSVNVTFNGNDSIMVGPFNTSGTFQLLCTIHQGMNLTVTVS
jgi:plastocyanin